MSRTVRIVRRVVLHYWVALVVLAVAVAAVMYFAARYLGGAAKVWTVIATIASALGVTAKGIGTSVTHLSEAAERPIYRQEEVDAMAWAITTLPSVQVTNDGVPRPWPERCREISTAWSGLTPEVQPRSRLRALLARTTRPLAVRTLPFVAFSFCSASDRAAAARSSTVRRATTWRSSSRISCRLCFLCWRRVHSAIQFVCLAAANCRRQLPPPEPPARPPRCPGADCPRRRGPARPPVPCGHHQPVRRRLPVGVATAPFRSIAKPRVAQTGRKSTV